MIRGRFGDLGGGFPFEKLARPLVRALLRSSSASCPPGHLHGHLVCENFSARNKRIAKMYYGRCITSDVFINFGRETFEWRENLKLLDWPEQFGTVWSVQFGTFRVRNTVWPHTSSKFPWQCVRLTVCGPSGRRQSNIDYNKTPMLRSRLPVVLRPNFGRPKYPADSARPPDSTSDSLQWPARWTPSACRRINLTWSTRWILS